MALTVFPPRKGKLEGVRHEWEQQEAGEELSLGYPAACSQAHHRCFPKQKGQLSASVTRGPEQGTQLLTGSTPRARPRPCTSLGRVSLAARALRAAGPWRELTLSPGEVCRARLGSARALPRGKGCPELVKVWEQRIWL